MLLVWSGGVNPAYWSFFEELGKHVELRVLTPKRWRHGSVEFTFPSRSERPVNYRLIQVAFLSLGHARYWIPSLIIHLFTHRSTLLYWMDEPDRWVTTVHAWIAKFFRPDLRICAYMLQNLEKPSYYRDIHRWAWSQNKHLIDGILAATKEAAEVARKHGYTGALQVVPLFASEKLFHPPTLLDRKAARERLGLQASDYVLAYAGSLHEAKGVLRLARIMQSFPRLRLLIASGDSWPNISKLANTPLLLGRLIGKEMLQLFHAADAVILPSEPRDHWKEQIGRILLEGGLSGCLALGSDSGAIPGIVGDADCLFHAGDDHSLQNLLEKLPFRDGIQKAKNQRDRYLAQYASTPVAEATLQFLLALRKGEFSDKTNRPELFGKAESCA